MSMSNVHPMVCRVVILFLNTMYLTAALHGVGNWKIIAFYDENTSRVRSDFKCGCAAGCDQGDLRGFREDSRGDGGTDLHPHKCEWRRGGDHKLRGQNRF